MPDYIANTQINSWVFNEKTVDNVLETLMEKGVRVNGGQDLGKTVIFAQNRSTLVSSLSVSESFIRSYLAVISRRFCIPTTTRIR